MMSKYATGRTYDYVAENTPRGRRYVLENYEPKSITSRSEPASLTAVNSPRQKGEYKTRHSFNDNEYLNIAEAKSWSSKQTESLGTARSPATVDRDTNHVAATKPNHVGTANAIQPTGNVTYRGRKRRLPRTTISNVSPRTPRFTETPAPSPVMVKGRQSNAVSPRKNGKKEGKGGTKNADKKGKKGETDKGQKNEKGALSARDQYMIGLYDGEITYLRPSQVRYTHDEIVSHFQDGKPLIATFKALLYGRVQIRFGGHDVPPIEVMQSDDLWFVVNGNRRLYVFKQLQKCGALKEMQVLVRRYDALVMDSHFSTRTMGRTIMLVNDGNMEDKIRENVRQWKEWKLKQSNQKMAPKKKGKATTNKKQDGSKSSSCCTIS